MYIVDSHAHIIPRALIKAHEAGRDWHGLRFESGPGGGIQSCVCGRTRRWPSAYWQNIEKRLEEMATRRVGMQVLSLSGPLLGHYLPLRKAVDALTEANDEIGEIVSAHPDHFAGLAALPLQDVGRSISELERAMKDLKLKGAIVGATVNGSTWDDPRWLPLLAAAEEMGAVLFIHPTIDGGTGVMQRYGLPDLVGQPLEITLALSSFVFGGILDRFPELKLLFAQGGGYAGYCAGRFDYGYQVREEARTARQIPSAYLERLYCDSLTYSAGSLALLIDAVGSHGVVLGSDYPSPMSLSDPVAWIESCGLDLEVQQSVLGDNAVRLFQLSSEN